MYEAYIRGHGWYALTSKTREDAEAAAKSIGAAKVRMKLLKAVCVWLDSDTSRDNPKWVVSKDELDEAGCAETTETLSIHNDVDEALREAMEQGQKLDLPVYSQPPDNPPELIQPAATPDE